MFLPYIPLRTLKNGSTISGLFVEGLVTCRLFVCELQVCALSVGVLPFCVLSVRELFVCSIVVVFSTREVELSLVKKAGSLKNYVTKS